MLNRICHLWANAVGYFDVWRQLADANAENVLLAGSLATERYEHDHTLRQRDGQWADFTHRVDDLEKQLGAADAHVSELNAVMEADAIERARDAETIAQLRVDLNHLKHANEVMKGKYREACELLTHRNATCEHYRKMYGVIDAALHPENHGLDELQGRTARCVGFAPVLDTTSCGDGDGSLPTNAANRYLSKEAVETVERAFKWGDEMRRDADKP